MTLFSVTYTYDEIRADERAGLLPDHRAWLTERQADGSLVEAGIYADAAMALLVFRFDSTDEASTRLDEDPFAAAGLVTSRVVHEWKPNWGPIAAVAAG